MGKNMARIKDGVVVNLEWVDDYIAETDDLKNIGNRLINVGDTYIRGKFCRNNTVVLSHEEVMLKAVSTYDNALNEIAAAISLLNISSETKTPSTISLRKQVILSHIEAAGTINDHLGDCLDG